MLRAGGGLMARMYACRYIACAVVACGQRQPIRQVEGSVLRGNLAAAEGGGASGGVVADVWRRCASNMFEWWCVERLDVFGRHRQTCSPRHVCERHSGEPRGRAAVAWAILCWRLRSYAGLGEAGLHREVPGVCRETRCSMGLVR